METASGRHLDVEDVDVDVDTRMWGRHITQP